MRIAIALLIIGIASQAGAATRLELSAEALIAWGNAVASQANQVPDELDTTHAREDCPTGGWITMDGRRTDRRCLDCRPKWPTGSSGEESGLPKSLEGEHGAQGPTDGAPLPSVADLLEYEIAKDQAEAAASAGPAPPPTYRTRRRRVLFPRLRGIR